MIWDVASQGFNGVDVTDNGYGIAVASGGGYQDLQQLRGPHHQPGRRCRQRHHLRHQHLAAVTTAGAVDLRDNILSNAQTLGTTAFGIINAATARVGPPPSTNKRTTRRRTWDAWAPPPSPPSAAWQGVRRRGTPTRWRCSPASSTATDLHLNVGPAAALAPGGGVENAGLAAQRRGDRRRGRRPPPAVPTWADSPVPPAWTSATTATHARWTAWQRVQRALLRRTPGKRRRPLPRVAVGHL
jgi:hypothetical protein